MWLSSGQMSRRLPRLPLPTGEGETAIAIAAHLNVSLASVRRFVTNLTLAKAVVAQPRQAVKAGREEGRGPHRDLEGVTPQDHSIRGAGPRGAGRS